MKTDFTKSTKELIDGLKNICAQYGLGNDGNEFKIITQVFLYKFMNDKFGYELEQIDSRFKGALNWEMVATKLPSDDYEKILRKLPPSTAKLKKEHYLSHLFNSQNTKNFAKLFDSTLLDISISNAEIFSVNTANNAKIVLYDELTQFLTDSSQRDDFAKALVNQLVNFSFHDIFDQKFDFFSTIFEYLIKDYNKDGGGKYAEYYTPHAVAKIMAAILVDKPVKNVTVYDPSAGSGTLLMNVAHQIGEQNCSIYSQDISQKSSGMLRLNLILNNLVHSIQNIIQGNTISSPYFRDGPSLKKFDYIISNPPFKLDFSDFHASLDSTSLDSRFFAGIPTIPKKDKDQMAIYLLFLQHIIASLASDGKAAIVVPTGFLTGSGIANKIRKNLVDSGYLLGVVLMPKNIFATTGTNVSVVFIDKSQQHKDVTLVDASKLGEIVKEGKNQKTLLSESDEQQIIDAFLDRSSSGIAKVVDFKMIADRNYSWAPGHFLIQKPEEQAISKEKFQQEVSSLIGAISVDLDEITKLKISLAKNLKAIGHEL
jgi:type I restriction enzyme M protein